MRPLGFVVAALAALLLAAPALAYNTNGVTVTPYATGFATSGRVGPLGVAFDQAGNLFAFDEGDGFVYRFSAAGEATPDKRLAAPGGGIAGLAVDGKGRLYATREDAGEVVELDPQTGAIKRTVADHLPCPEGIAADSFSGGLAVTSGCRSEVRQITDLDSKSPHTALLTDGPFDDGIAAMDGIAVAPDGTVFTTSGAAIVQIDGAGSATPGHFRTLTSLPGADGIGVGPGVAGNAEFLLVNRNDGHITRLDLTGPSPVAEDIVDGGTRGDFAAVDAHGCFYATQTSEIIRLTDPDGSCAARTVGTLQPSTPAATPEPATEPDPVTPAGCVDTRKFTWRLHHGAAETVLGVDIFVDGKRRVHKRGKSIETVSLTKLPQGAFRVRIVATHSNGERLVTARRYKGCKKGKPRGRHHHHRSLG